MQIAVIGLGRMGANITRRLLRAGLECVVHDVDRDALAALASEGATPALDLAEVAALLRPPRAAWLMIPAAHTGAVVDDLAAHLEPGDIVIDGGNSNYRDDLARAAELGPRGIHYVDVGTSGGVFGLERGYCLMIGGEPETVDHLAPVFAALAPGLNAVARTEGRAGEPAPEEEGWLHCGPVGAGHFVKMVHNGVEYGLMAAYAEGLNILRHAGDGNRRRRADAETAPLREPHLYQYDIDVAAVTELWRRGSVVSSWLLDLTAAALARDPALAGFAGHVADSGEGRWTVMAAVDEGVPVPVLATALFERFSSQGRQDFADRVLSAMRQEFGGHAEIAREHHDGGSTSA
ncbi:MAG TPA: decarboxylating 6-phosphogluconate dehydrogenase [Acidimicrobiales bacterium]|nr:decarboxylating 6-phosphogluconate dehydrogenase [Acidimicrobiales bacterium]